METGRSKQRWVVRGMASAAVFAGLALLAACSSSEQPKPMVQPTPDQVRGHADRAFDKLKQEEQERNAQVPAVR